MSDKFPNRVLLVQDDPKQTELWSELIRGVAKCQIDVVSQAEASLEWLARFNYTLMVLDLPARAQGERDSLEFLEAVRRVSPSTSVIVVTANVTVEQAVAVIRLGAEDYLRKPFDLETFQLTVKRGLDRKLIFANSNNASNYLNLLSSCQMISGSLDQSRILGVVQSYVMRELKSEHGAMYRVQDGQVQRFEEVGPDPSHRDSAMEEIIEIALHASGAIHSMQASAESMRFFERGSLTPGLFVFRFRLVGIEDCMCVCLAPRKPDDLKEFESRMRMLKAQIELTGKNISEYQGVRKLAFMDDATGLYNTRYLYNILDREIELARTHKQSFAILFMDGDRFKSINDTHGHLVGTKLLNEMGAQLKKFVRGNDTVFRYGGDEFVAVLSNCDLATARRVAERIRSSIEKHPFLHDEGKDIRITVSIGVALFPDHADSIKAVIDAADHAMYSAKKSTRNSVFVAPIPPPQDEKKPDTA